MIDWKRSSLRLFYYFLLLLFSAHLTLSLLIFDIIYLIPPFPDDYTLTALAVAYEERAMEGGHIWVALHEHYAVPETLIITRRALKRLNPDRDIMERYGRFTELRVVEQLPPEISQEMSLLADVSHRYHLANGQEVLFFAAGQRQPAAPVYVFYRGGQVIFTPAAPAQS